MHATARRRPPWGCRRGLPDPETCMSTFHVWWLISGVALLALAAAIGWRVRKSLTAILIDQRGRYSLTHFQLVLWTIAILSSMIGVLIAHDFDPTSIIPSPELLGLMGISAGSAALSTGVKAMKDAAGVRVAREGVVLRAGEAPVKPHFAQIWLEEEGRFADRVVSITKYQNFLFTLVILVIYLSAGWKAGDFPVLSDNVIWLIGISHAGYVTGKIPNKT